MRIGKLQIAAGHSPWTDPRSLGLSVLIHAVLLGLGSLLVLAVKVPSSSGPTAFLTAEVGPVDNRAEPESGGGSPGTLGGSASITLSGDRSPGEEIGPREGSADALIASVLPSARIQPTREDGPSGPSTMGPGLLPGAGSGGGGGSGGGVGGGVGSGVGPGTEFFGTPERALSFAFVIDYSGSMSHRNALRIAKTELLQSLDRLPPDAQFAVVFYNVQSDVFLDARGKRGLMPATQENKAVVRDRMSSIRPEGGTDHARALRAAIALKPEVIYFLTDAETMDDEVAVAIQAEAGPIRIQAIEFGDGPASAGNGAIRTLATGTGGSFRHVDISEIAAKSR